MRMELHTPHSRVRNSGFGLPIGRKDPGQGQKSSSLNFLAQKCLFLTPKKHCFLCLCASDDCRRRLCFCGFLSIFSQFFRS